MTDTGPLFVSSGDLLADRRYKAAIELASRGDFPPRPISCRRRSS